MVASSCRRSSPYSERSAELRRNGDLRNATERFRNRAILLGKCHFLVERGLRDARHYRQGYELDLGDGGTCAEVDRGTRFDAGRGVTGGGELRSQEHREATGLRRADQFFGVGARGGAFEA